MINFKSIYKIDIYYFMIFSLSVLVFFGILEFGISNVLPQVLISVSSAAVFDLIHGYIRFKNFRVPKSSIISGFFVSMIFAPPQPWYVLLFATAVVVISKNILRVKARTLLNPAALALTLSILFFPAVHAWWGASFLPAIILLGLFVPFRLKRFDLIIPFFVVYLILVSSQTFLAGDFQNLQFRILDRAVLFFMFFMLTEPMTTPIKNKGRIIYGSLAAIFMFLLVNYYPTNLLLGLLAVNLLSPILNSKLWQKQ